jgi:hypothetical protein
MAVGQIENGFLRQLLCVVGAGSSLEDNHVIRIDYVEVADSTIGDPIDVALDELGKLLVVFAESEPVMI